MLTSSYADRREIVNVDHHVDDIMEKAIEIWDQTYLGGPRY